MNKVMKQGEGSKEFEAVVDGAIAKLNCPVNGGNHPHGFLDRKTRQPTGQCECGVWWDEACAATRVLVDYSAGRLVVAVEHK